MNDYPKTPNSWPGFPTLPAGEYYLNPKGYTPAKLGGGEYRPLCTLDETYPSDHEIIYNGDTWSPARPCTARPRRVSYITFRTRQPVPEYRTLGPSDIFQLGDQLFCDPYPGLLASRWIPINPDLYGTTVGESKNKYRRKNALIAPSATVPEYSDIAASGSPWLDLLLPNTMEAHRNPDANRLVEVSIQIKELLAGLARRNEKADAEIAEIDSGSKSIRSKGGFFNELTALVWEMSSCKKEIARAEDNGQISARIVKLCGEAGDLLKKLEGVK